MRLAIDHLAVAAETLAEGRAMVEAALGVRLEEGGRHPHFGTHNLLLGLGEGLYLEVIAVDPAAPAPQRSRWFGLDRFAGRPRPVAWICRTDDFDAALAGFPEAGEPMALSRGDLRWRMAVPGSGSRFKRLEVAHPEAEALQARLAPVLDDARVIFVPGPGGLRAEFETPWGRRWLQ